MIAYRWRRRLRVRWLMVTGYVVVLSMAWFAGEAFRTRQWAVFAMTVWVVTIVGYMLATGRRR